MREEDEREFNRLMLELIDEWVDVYLSDIAPAIEATDEMIPYRDMWE